MSEAVKLFPAIHIDLLSGPEEFVLSWDRCFKYDDIYADMYEENYKKTKYTEGDLLAMFEWKYGKLSPERLKEFKKEVITHLDLINELRLDPDIDKFMSVFIDLESRWQIMMLHITLSFPLFDEHSWRAYHFIHTAEKLGELPFDEDEMSIRYGEYCNFFWDMQKKTPGCSLEQLNNSLWAFGKFLKDYGSLFF